MERDVCCKATRRSDAGWDVRPTKGVRMTYCKGDVGKWRIRCNVCAAPAGTRKAGAAPQGGS